MTPLVRHFKLDIITTVRERERDSQKMKYTECCCILKIPNAGQVRGKYGVIVTILDLYLVADSISFIARTTSIYAIYHDPATLLILPSLIQITRSELSGDGAPSLCEMAITV